MNTSSATWRISSNTRSLYVDLRALLAPFAAAFQELQIVHLLTRDNQFVATSISAVEASQPERLVSAAADVGAMASQLDNLITMQRESLAELRDGWTGGAADAAIARGEQNLTVQEALRDRLHTLQGVLASGGGQLNSARTALLDMVGELRGQGWEISDDGVTTPPPNLSEAFRSVPQAYTLMIQRLLETYAVIDDETADGFPIFEPGG